MNITNSFVFIHMPKTGGTFVSSVLRKLHHTGRLHDVMLRKESMLFAKYKLLKLIKGKQIDYLEFNKHGTCREIPVEYRNLPILSCIRNPFDWYVSNYKYAWWRSHPQDYPGLQDHSKWPNLGFSEYLSLSNAEWVKILNPNVTVNSSLGRFTILFINYYCEHPDEVVSLQDDDALFSAIQSNMFPITFMETSNLNSELYQILLSTGDYTTEQMKFILNKEKISPRNQRKAIETWQSFFSNEEKNDIYYRDRFLFKLFPRYDPLTNL
ncbi:MAG: sulfotransferase family 2 domain-containing protein [Flavobacteriales bacterium]|nr:sulfotransferase family 2 domain-containing protein [Flavobacteriales bacterium]